MTLLSVYPGNGRLAARTDRNHGFSDMYKELFENERPFYSGCNPRVNIVENKDSFDLEMALPGFLKEDIKIDMDKNVLSISYESQENANGEKSYSRKEFGKNSFKRAFRIPETVNADEIHASMENGILKIFLPKREEAKDKGPRAIDIM